MDQGSVDVEVPDLVRRRRDGLPPGRAVRRGRGRARRGPSCPRGRVWIFGGGVERQRASIVDTDGTVTDGPYPETKAVIGGFVIIDVSSHQEAAGVGRQVRRRLPLCARGTRDHVRPARLIAAGPASVPGGALRISEPYAAGVELGELAVTAISLGPSPRAVEGPHRRQVAGAEGSRTRSLYRCPHDQCPSADAGPPAAGPVTAQRVR